MSVQHPRQRTVAVIGASNNRNKYGNKAVRAYAAMGYQVYPISPHEDQIEGLRAYKSVLDVPGPVDRVTIYVPPKVGMRVIEEVARKGVAEVFLNPGADSEELLMRARELGLEPVVACSIRDVGVSPSTL